MDVSLTRSFRGSILLDRFVHNVVIEHTNAIKQHALAADPRKTHLNSNKRPYAPD